MRKKLKEIYLYLGLSGTIVCVIGTSIMVAPIVLIAVNNMRWNDTVSYKNKIVKSGIKVSYDFCEGNKEYIISKNKEGGTKGIVICTQKSRKEIGKPEYIKNVLYKASGINP
jgi:hypothetical protein